MAPRGIKIDSINQIDNTITGYPNEEEKGFGRYRHDGTAHESLRQGPLEKDAHRLQTQQHRGGGMEISGLARESHPGRQEKEKTETE